MKVIIAGGRNFNKKETLFTSCDYFLKNVREEIEIVSGGARGADKLGEDYAKTRGYKLTQFFPDYSIVNKRAAPIIRNKKMGDYADALIAFFDGKSKGTGQMISYAKEKGLLVRIVKF